MGVVISPPVGRSGPFTFLQSASIEVSGFSSRSRQASIASRRLCGGIDVAMPTAMPSLPFTSRLGNWAGTTTGSKCCPS